MAYILDAIVLAVAVTCVFLGYRRGFVRTMIQLVGCLAAIFLAYTFSDTVATFVYDDIMRDGLHRGIVETWDESVANGAQTITEQVDAVVETLPKFVQKVIDTDALSTLTQSSTSTHVADYVVDTLIRPTMLVVLRFVAFILLFILLSFLIKLLEKLLKPITKIPLIRQADGVLGTLLGLVKGAILVIVAVTLMQLIAIGAPFGPFTNENLEKSVIAGRVAEINPLSTALNLD